MPLTLLAQDNKGKPQNPSNNPLEGQEDMILENERIFDLMESDKSPIYYPVREMETPDVTEIEFLSKDYFFDSKVEAPAVVPEKINPASLGDKEKKIKIFNHYLKLGLGKYLTPLGKLYLGSNPDNDLKWAVVLQHVSAHADKIRLRNFRDEDARFTLSSDKNNHWEINIRGGNNQYFLYGTPDIFNIKTPSDRMKDSLNRGFSYADLRFQADNKANTEKFYYNIPVSFKNIWDKKIAADSVSGNAEYNVAINPDLAFLLNEDLRFGITPEAAFSFGKTADQSISRLIVNGTPYAAYEKNNIRAKAGVVLGYYNLLSGPLKRDEFKVFPSIEAEYYLPSISTSFYGGYKGGIVNNTYRDMLENCRYLNPYAQILPTVEKMNIFLGGKTLLMSRYDIRVKAFYRTLENPLLFTGSINNGWIQAQYDSLTKNIGFELETNYSIRQDIQIGGSFSWNQFNTASAKAFYGVPPIQLRLFSRLQFLNNRLNIKPVFYLYGKTPLGQDGNGAVVYRGIMPDFNLNAEYRITERFSAWVQFNNMFGANQYPFMGYPERKFDFMGGIGFIF